MVTSMNYYALIYELVDDMVNRRVPFREEHLRLAAKPANAASWFLPARSPNLWIAPCSFST